MIRLKKLLEDIPMGDVAFGESPRMAKYQNASEENNTQAEAELYNLLKRWFEGNPGAIGAQGEYSGRLSQEFEKIKTDLFKLKKKFPKVFDTPDTYGFRGTSISDSYEYVYELIKNSPDVFVVANHGKHFLGPVIAIPYEYKPKSPVQSWSSIETVAETFADGGRRKLILITKVDDSFIMNPRASNELSDLRESEMLHFGKDIKTYLVISSYNVDNIFQILYEILEGYKPNALQDSDVDLYDLAVKHKDYKTKFTPIDSYDNLPW